MGFVAYDTVANNLEIQNTMVDKKSFKLDIFDAIFKVAGKTWMKVTGVVIINNAIVILLAVLPILALLGTESPIFQLFSNPEYFQQNQDEFQAILYTPQVGGALLILLSVALLVGAWGFVTNLRITNSQVLTGAADLRTHLAESLTWDIAKMFGVFLLFYLMLMVGFMVAAMFAIASVWLTILVLLFFLVFLAKFTLVIPAMFVGGMSFPDAIRYSNQNITWSRALRLLGIIVLAILIMIVGLMIVGMLAIVLAKVPFIGIGLQYLLQWVLAGFMATLGSAALVGLYYRYEKEKVADSVEDDSGWKHLEK